MCIRLFEMLQYIVSSSVLLYIRILSDFLQPMLIFPQFLFLCLDRSTANSMYHDNDEYDFTTLSIHSTEVFFRAKTIATSTDYNGLIDR